VKLCYRELMGVFEPREDTTEALNHTAVDAHPDHTVIAVSESVYEEFVARFDDPPRPNARLRRSLQTAAPWEKRP